jgi:ribosomal-protein-alanine N-acetyltransferase
LKGKPKLVIKTERLVLRDFNQKDLSAYQALCSHSDFQQFYAEEDATPEKVEQLLKMFLGWATEQPRSKFQLAIELPSARLIGSCGVRITSVEEKQGTFGCELSRTHWGKGYALEASRAVIDFGFTELNLHRIYAETNSENMAAIALAKKLGLRVEGELRENKRFRGRRWNTTMLSILRSEWRQLCSVLQRTPSDNSFNRSAG